MAKKTANESILREKTVRTSKPKIKLDSRFKSLKSMSILSVVLVIAICIVGNIILSLTLDKTLTFDTSSLQANTVSKFTKEYLDNLEKKVEIIGLFDRNDDSIPWKEYFLPILDDYEAKADGKIELSYIDPDMDPFILDKLDPNGLYQLQKYTYVVRCGDNLVTVYPLDCLEPDPYYYQYNVFMPVTNNVELKFTGYIVYVSSDRPLHAYYLDGHDLPSHTYFDTILNTLGFVSSTVNLKSESASVPSDCSLLVILEPSSDLTLSEKEMIKTYLDNSGKVLLVHDYNENKKTEYPNLNEVTKRMGVTLENGVIHENDIDYLVNQDNPYSSIAAPVSSYSEYIASVYASSLPQTYNVEHCRYLKLYNDRGEHVYVSPLVVTSDTASVDFSNTEIDANVSAGQYPVILQCVDDSKSDMACMIIVSTNTFTSDDYYSVYSLDDGNAMLIKTVLGDISPIQVNVLVPSRKVPSYILSKPLSSSAATMWSVVVMTVIPVGCLICGIYIYRRRRHL